MSDAGFIVHGARGSAPTSGNLVRRYGGHTTCYSVDAGSDGTILVDAGTAIGFTPSLVNGGPYHILFTHYHLDHVQGLPFFAPLYDPTAEVVFYGRPPRGMTLEDALRGVFRPPWFPVDFASTPARRSFVDLSEKSELQLGGVSVTTGGLNHPQGCLAYRFDRGGSSVVIATDHEAGDDTIDGALRDLADRAGVLFHDGQYTHEEYVTRIGWGHSTWEAAAKAADRARVDRLVLTSHDPTHTDDVIDDMVRMAADVFDDVAAAAPGMHVPI